MTFETTVGFIGGSKTTVIPSGLSKLLNINKGDKIKWEADITDAGIIVTVIPEKTESSP